MNTKLLRDIKNNVQPVAQKAADLLRTVEDKNGNLSLEKLTPQQHSELFEALELGQNALMQIITDKESYDDEDCRGIILGAVNLYFDGMGMRKKLQKGRE